MFVAGTSKKAKEIAVTLSNDAGYTTYDLGGDEKVEFLEEICKVWITLSASGIGRNFAIKIMKR